MLFPNDRLPPTLCTMVFGLLYLDGEAAASEQMRIGSEISCEPGKEYVRLVQRKVHY